MTCKKILNKIKNIKPKIAWEMLRMIQKPKGQIGKAFPEVYYQYKTKQEGHIIFK